MEAVGEEVAHDLNLKSVGGGCCILYGALSVTTEIRSDIVVDGWGSLAGPCVPNPKESGMHH